MFREKVERKLDYLCREKAAGAGGEQLPLLVTIADFEEEEEKLEQENHRSQRVSIRIFNNRYTILYRLFVLRALNRR